MILITFIKFYKISAPSPDSHNKVPVQFRVDFCIKESVSVKGIQLKLMTPHLHVRAYQHRKFLHGLIVSEDAFVKFDGERSSVYGIFKMRSRE